MENGNTCCNMRHIPNVKRVPLPIQYFFFSFNPVKFQESKYSSQLFDLSFLGYVF